MHASAPADLIQHRVDDRGDAGCVAYITVNNAAKRNTLGMPGKRAIADTFNQLAKNERIRVAVITGAGDKSFIAGADIAEMKDLNAEQAEVEHTLTHVANESIQMFPVPVIARINGWCLGFGMELAAACDMRIGVDTAKFGMPEVRVGIPSGMEADCCPRSSAGVKRRSWFTPATSSTHRKRTVAAICKKSRPPLTSTPPSKKWSAPFSSAVRTRCGCKKHWCAIGNACRSRTALRQGIRACVAARSTDEPKRMMEAFINRKRK